MKVNNKRNDIIDIAYNLFISNGYDNVSVDEIIAVVGIAKGTFYYYFKTKEELLEEVINKMIVQEKEVALNVLNSDMSIEEKLVGIIVSMRPNLNEMGIAMELNKQENVIMHKKINAKIIEVATPLITVVVNEGIKDKIFNCDNIKERVKLILTLSNQLFDDGDYSALMIDVFIDTIEKILGAKSGTMMFIKSLIGGGVYENNN